MSAASYTVRTHDKSDGDDQVDFRRWARGTDADIDVLGPAALWAGCAGLITWFSAWLFAHKSRFLNDHPTGAYLVLAAAALAAAVLVYVIAQWALRRPRAGWWFMGATMAVLLVGAASTPATAAYLYPEPADRYHRELGGPGRCLNLSPYATKDAFPVSSWMNDRDPAQPGRMVIQPLDKSAPVLILDHAVRGGTHRLTPADEQSAAILRAHNC